MKKKILSLLLALSCMGANAYAYDIGDMSAEYKYFETVSGIGAEMFIDESITAEDIMKMGLNKLLEENPELVEQILKYGFSEVDDYTEYYNSLEYWQFLNNINHTFYGIGVVIQKEGDYVKVTRCMEGGSAEAAGLQSGDKIVKVNGENCVGMTLDTVQAMVVGELGTTVSVIVLRDSGEYTYEMERRPVSDQTVSYAALEGNVGYIEIINFAAETADEFADCLEEMRNLGVDKLIIDLRDNPGGYLQTAIDMGSMVVPKGVIIQTMYRHDENNETYYSELEEKEFDIIILVNSGTASAAEVFSAAVRESGAGILVGETTYGKALIQEIIHLGDGTAFKITTGKYLTRNGNDINKIGITPDIEIANPKRKITTSNYTQFDYKTKWREGTAGDGVVAAKERLYLLGYDITNLNNTFDAELTEAVTRFQEKNGLFPYGVLDITTQVKMENLFAELDETVDMQMITAYRQFGGTEEQLYKK